MKLIPLRGKNGLGKFTMVDDEDYDYLMQFKWYGNKGNSKHNYYATSCFNKKTNYLHRVVMNAIDKTLVIDHIDRNSLNNQKSNLRFATHSQNVRNRNSKKNGSSQYLGVSANCCYIAQIKSNDCPRYIGRFPYTPEGEIAAAKAYDEAAKKIHGEFANLNFKE